MASLISDYSETNIHTHWVNAMTYDDFIETSRASRHFDWLIGGAIGSWAELMVYREQDRVSGHQPSTIALQYRTRIQGGMSRFAGNVPRYVLGCFTVEMRPVS